MNEQKPLRILCITDEFPWPPTHGYRMRIVNTLGGLAEIGSVDLFCAVADRPDLPEGPISPPPGVQRAFIHRRGTFGPSIGGLRRWATSRLPRAVAWTDWRHPETALAGWAAPRYNLVWFSHGHSWLALEGARQEPTIVDLDNLEDERIKTWQRVRRLQGERPRGRLRSHLRARIAGRLDRIDMARWRSAHARAAATTRAVVVCSNIDRARLSSEAAVVIPNGYEATQRRMAPTTGATLAMVGLMIYPPNGDGARYFATQVLPLVRDQVPEARFRIVGRHDGELADLADVPGVEVVGEVENVGEALQEAAAIVVPLRAGSGTRIKVLEAFALGIPVVSTTLGCEGLGARDGEELLLGDTPGDLASACVRVIGDRKLAARLSEAGYRLWENCYRADAIRSLTAQVAREAAE